MLAVVGGDFRHFLNAGLVGVCIGDGAAFFAGFDAEFFQSLVFAGNRVGNRFHCLHQRLAHRCRSVPQGLQQTAGWIESVSAQAHKRICGFIQLIRGFDGEFGNPLHGLFRRLRTAFGGFQNGLVFLERLRGVHKTACAMPQTGEAVQNLLSGDDGAAADKGTMLGNHPGAIGALAESLYPPSPFLPQSQSAPLALQRTGRAFHFVAKTALGGAHIADIVTLTTQSLAMPNQGITHGMVILSGLSELLLKSGELMGVALYKASVTLAQGTETGETVGFQPLFGEQTFALCP